MIKICNECFIIKSNSHSKNIKLIFYPFKHSRDQTVLKYITVPWKSMCVKNPLLLLAVGHINFTANN